MQQHANTQALDPQCYICEIRFDNQVTNFIITAHKYQADEKKNSNRLYQWEQCKIMPKTFTITL